MKKKHIISDIDKIVVHAVEFKTPVDIVLTAIDYVLHDAKKDQGSDRWDEFRCDFGDEIDYCAAELMTAAGCRT